jgi:transposase
MVDLVENLLRRVECLRRSCAFSTRVRKWHMLPQSFPNYKTVHRRFQTWSRDEILRRVLTDVARASQQRCSR